MFRLIWVTVSIGALALMSAIGCDSGSDNKATAGTGGVVAAGGTGTPAAGGTIALPKGGSGGAGGTTVVTPPAPVCGDNEINTTNEQCDGTAMGTGTCESLVQGTGTVTCTDNCEYDTTACTVIEDSGPYGTYGG